MRAYLKYDNNKQTTAYSAWVNMKGRVKRLAAYEDVTICEEWLDYQVFAEWFHKQHRELGWQLDKDILKKGNRVYCPEHCVYVPQAINLLTIRKQRLGEYPVGVTLRKDTGRYNSEFTSFSVRVPLGSYDTAQEALAAYTTAKEAHIRDLVTNPAYGYAQILDPRVITALLNWKVTT